MTVHKTSKTENDINLFDLCLQCPKVIASVFDFMVHFHVELQSEDKFRTFMMVRHPFEEGEITFQEYLFLISNLIATQNFQVKCYN